MLFLSSQKFAFQKGHDILYVVGNVWYVLMIFGLSKVFCMWSL